MLTQARSLPPGGEKSGLEAQRRIVPFLDFLVARHQQKHVAVVFHKSVCRLAVCHVFGIFPQSIEGALLWEMPR